jgi:hypothetical protein
MDHFGLVEAVDGLGQRVVVGIADAADGRFDPGFGEVLGVADRDVLGGFNRSSQHLDKGECDDYSKATFGSVRARSVAITGPASGGAT